MENKKYKDESKRKRKIILLIILTGCLVILTILYYSQKTNEVYSKDTMPEIVQGDQAIENLDEVVQETQNITAYALISIEADGQTGKWYFYNDKDNQIGQQAVIRLDDSNKIIYQSGVIEPGSFIENIKFSEPLKSGKYKATVTIESYDLDKKLLNSSMGAVATIIEVV